MLAVLDSMSASSLSADTEGRVSSAGVKASPLLPLQHTHAQSRLHQT